MEFTHLVLRMSWKEEFYLQKETQILILNIGYSNVQTFVFSFLTSKSILYSLDLSSS
jgi:hypothetical protein